MLLILFCLLFNVIDGIPLAKLHDTSISFGGISLAEMPNSDLMNQIMTSKDDEEALLSVLSDADPAQINQIITLLKGLLAASRTELDGLITSSANADADYNAAVAAHNAAIVAQTNGEATLETDKATAISDANTAYNQGVAALQAAVTAAKSQVDSTNSTKNTANGLLAVDKTRLESEIRTLTTVIALMESVLGINTASPTSSPTGQCRWLEEPQSTCNNNRNMICNNQNTPECTLDYCKNQAISMSYKYFTYGTGYWCIMCNADANGLMIDAGDRNTAYTLYTYDCSV
jgi:hypothetical protein